MENLINVYCRFCAEAKSEEKTINFLKDENKHSEVLSKLNFLHAKYVDLTNRDNILPKTMCFVCYDSLNKAYEFLVRVKEAQSILTTIMPSLNRDRSEYSDDDATALDDLFDNNEPGYAPVKEEDTKLELQETATAGSSLAVKSEPRDEADEQLSEALSVEYLLQLNSALCNASYQCASVCLPHEPPDPEKRVITKWKHYPWVCSQCDIEFLDISTLRLHAKLTHGKCNAFACVDCKNFVDGDFDAFISHVRRHRRKLRKRCEYCDESVGASLLSVHCRGHFQNRQVPCNFCGEILKDEDMLQKHLGEVGTTKQKRKPRRKRGTPLTIADLTCSLCQKVYKNPNSLRDHMKLHTDNRKRNYTCDRCGKTFFNKGTLTSHIMAHDQVRPHICMICNKSFLFPNMLRRHVEMHTGIKPFSCEQCGKCFRLQYQLNAHKIIHTDSMPHICQYCSKAFRFKQILKNHERQHTGAKPYACQKCNMEFTNWSNYNKHMKRRHDLDTSKKKITPEGVFPINPDTGELMHYNDASTEEWKSKIMIPAKRGKKKCIKKEET
ncbi:zinc finger protein 93-like [Aricia agestis]|uniref:zinc finger protein 93-like n=1 Tax=Aricia agestis TaxID=91739 RepID=UPI001C205C36|nr:zinc finger protein 93-like [Aricia agestis]